tara:strand:- start:202 stop:465 length:264 start_codon:yes stop_codon:yes gene_type:complete
MVFSNTVFIIIVLIGFTAKAQTNYSFKAIIKITKGDSVSNQSMDLGLGINVNSTANHACSLETKTLSSTNKGFYEHFSGWNQSVLKL